MTLEGMLGPNGRLDEARGIKVGTPDALCVAADGRLLFSDGQRVMTLEAWGGQPEHFASFDAPVTALCQDAGGHVAVGLAGGTLAVLDEAGRRTESWSLPAGQVASIVDCAFTSDGHLLLVDCGYQSSENLLAMAAWDAEARGRLLALSRTGELRVVASGLHCPMGVCLDPDGTPLVALLEMAMIVDADGKPRQAGYPGYLGRIRRKGAGYVVACWSRRDPLIEVLKTEQAFVEKMKATIEPRHWIGPRIKPEFSHDFPIELGATRLFGEVKPWAPSFSYGLVIETDETLMPIESMQSRANGHRHGICDVAVWNGDLIAVSKGSGEILSLGGRA